jgi:hypothetical protein
MRCCMVEKRVELSGRVAFVPLERGLRLRRSLQQLLVPDARGRPRHLVHSRVVDVSVETEALRDLGVRRIPEHGTAGANHDGHVVQSDAKPIQQLLRGAVTVEVDVVKRMSVTRQELFDAKRAGAVSRAYDNDVAQIVCDSKNSSVARASPSAAWRIFLRRMPWRAVAMRRSRSWNIC